MGLPPNHMLMKGKKTAKYFEQIVGPDGAVTYQPKIYRDKDNKKVDSLSDLDMELSFFSLLPVLSPFRFHLEVFLAGVSVIR